MLCVKVIMICEVVGQNNYVRLECGMISRVAFWDQPDCQGLPIGICQGTGRSA